MMPVHVLSDLGVCTFPTTSFELFDMVHTISTQTFEDSHDELGPNRLLAAYVILLVHRELLYLSELIHMWRVQPPFVPIGVSPIVLHKVRSLSRLEA